MNEGTGALQIGEPIALGPKSPNELLGDAKEMAMALKAILESKPKKVMFNGEQYLEYEDWQVLGKFCGLTVKTKDAVAIEINGISGAKAAAEVVDTRTGFTVGSAEAYCLKDEPNWARKPWFQLASMAQTRAGAKSLRNILAWVVVMAGYKPTPAEEMVMHEEHRPAPKQESIPVTRQDDDNLLTSTFSISDPIPSKNKPGNFYRKATDAEGASYYVHDNTVISDLNINEGKEVTVRLKRDGKWTSIAGVLS